MAENSSGRPVPRPKRPIRVRPVARPKRLLLASEAVAAGPGVTGNNAQFGQLSDGSGSPQSHDKTETSATDESTTKTSTKFSRRSLSDVKAELDGLGIQLNNVRGNTAKGEEKLRSARGWLQELKDNAPLPHLPIGPSSVPLKELTESLQSIRRWVRDMNKTASPKKGRNFRKRPKIYNPDLILDTISVALDIVGNMIDSRDSALHFALVNKQKRIVSELERQVEALEKEDREILAQIADKQREKENTPPAEWERPGTR